MGSPSAGLEEMLVGFVVPDLRALLGVWGGAKGLVDVMILAEQGGSRVASDKSRGGQNCRERTGSGLKQL